MSRYGHWDDGGWNLCASALPPPDQPCVVYSFGINKDTSFEFDFVRRHPHCTIYAFDPSIGRETGDDFHPRIKFFNVGVSGKAKTEEVNGVVREMMTLEGVMSMLGHEWLDVLKMDIERSEWGVLGDMVSSKKWVHVELWPVTQILAELHFSPDAIEFEKNARSMYLLGTLEKGGYRVFSRDEDRPFSYPVNIQVSNSSHARVHHVLEVGFVHSAKYYKKALR